MANSKELSKQEEIALLEKLGNGNGYFAEYFGKDIDQMVSNIRNDFPIETSTSVELLEIEVRDRKEANFLLKDEIKSLKGQLSDQEAIVSGLGKEMGKILNEAVKAGCLEIMEFFSIGEIIEAKLKLGIGLTEEEVKHVICRL